MKRARRVGELFAGTLGLAITVGISFVIAIILIFMQSVTLMDFFKQYIQP